MPDRNSLYLPAPTTNSEWTVVAPKWAQNGQTFTATVNTVGTEFTPDVTYCVDTRITTPNSGNPNLHANSVITGLLVNGCDAFANGQANLFYDAQYNGVPLEGTGTPKEAYGGDSFTFVMQINQDAVLSLWSSNPNDTTGPVLVFQSLVEDLSKTVYYPQSANCYNLFGDSSLKPDELERIRRRNALSGSGVNTSGCACASGDCPPFKLGAAEGAALGALVYNSANAPEDPQSPGYGWSMGDIYARVAIEPNDDDETNSTSPNYLDFYDGQGSFDRWNILNAGTSSESYTPLYSDMYTAAYKNTDNSYTLVFQDLTLMNFQAWDGSNIQGKILKKQDNNGNYVNYNYDGSGRVSSVVDSDGHSSFFDYGTRTDGQPMGIYSQVSGGPQNVQFTYDTSNRLQQTMVNVQTVLDGVTTNSSYSHNFAYDTTFGQLASITDPRGNYVVQYTYYPTGDPNAGRVETETTYVQTAALPGQAENPASTGLCKSTYVYSFNSDNSGTIQITEQDLTDSTSLNRVTLNTYNIRRQLTQSQVSVENAPGGSYTWSYEYNDTLNYYLMTRSIDPNENTTGYVFDDNGNPTSITDALGRTTTYAYTSVTFNGTSIPLLSIIQPPAVTVGGVLQAAGYGATNLTYDSLGNLIQVQDPVSPDGLNHITSYTRRSDGRITAITDRNGTNNGHNTNIGNSLGVYNGNVVAIEYTSAVSGSSNTGNISQIAFQSGETGPPSAPLSYINFEYDFYDNLVSVSDPLGNTVTNIWDSLNRLVKTQPLPPSGTPGQDYTQYVYSNEQLDHIDLPNNSVANTTTGDRRLVQFAYDVASRVSTLSGLPMPAAPTPTQQLIAGYGYDGWDNIVSLTRLKRPGGSAPTPLSWNFQYDQLDRQVLATDTLQPVGRQTTTSYPHVCMAYTQTSPRGIPTTYSFDALCRMVHIENPGEDDQIAYDEWGRIVSITQMNGVQSEFSTPTSPEPARFGQARFQDPRLQPSGMVWTFLYDALSRLSQVTYPDGTTLVYTRDNEGNVLTVKDQTNVTTTYTYYPYPGYRIATVSVTVGTSTETWSYEYDGSGRVSQIAYPNGITALFSDTVNSPPQFGWDYKGQLLGINYVFTATGATLQSFSYLYDNSGNRVSCTDTFVLPGNSAVTTTTDYGYDGFNRLVSAGSNSYSYDESDNRMAATVGGQSYTFVVDGADQLETRTSGAETDTFSFDQDGNLLSRTLAGVTNSNTWDDKNKLIRIKDGSNNTLESNTYDVGGLRRGTDPNITYYNSGSTSIADSRPTPQGPVAFVQGHQILGFQANNALYTYVTDALGSVRHVLDSSGNVKYSFVYDEFGNATPTDRTGGDSTLAGLCQLLSYCGSLGVRNEPSTGLLLMGQRWYDPVTGRWLSQDPIGFDGGLNLFNYAGQNAMNFVDPSGLAHIYVVYGEDSWNWLFNSFGAGRSDVAAMQAGGNTVTQLPLTEKNLKVAIADGDIVIIDSHGLNNPDGKKDFWGFSNKPTYNKAKDVSVDFLARVIKSNSKHKQLIFGNACYSGMTSKIKLGPKQVYVGWSGYAAANTLPFDLTAELLKTHESVGQAIDTRNSQNVFSGSLNPNTAGTVYSPSGNLDVKF